MKKTDTENALNSAEQFFSEPEKTERLSEDEEYKLGMDILEGRNREQAVEKLAEANIRLVRYIASKYVWFGLEKNELIDEGYMGLRKAAAMYDVTKGCRFSTYAVTCIENAIRRGISLSESMIRMPEAIRTELRKLDKLSNELVCILGREPSISELAEKSDIPVKRVEELFSYRYSVSSLDAHVSEESEDSLSEMIEDPNAMQPEEELFSGELYTLIRNAIDMLPEKEADIIRYRYGFYGRVYTLSELADIYGLTKERIRQIEDHALKTIRRSGDCYEQLKEYC